MPNSDYGHTRFLISVLASKQSNFAAYYWSLLTAYLFILY